MRSQPITYSKMIGFPILKKMKSEGQKIISLCTTLTLTTSQMMARKQCVIAIARSTLYMMIMNTIVTSQRLLSKLQLPLNDKNHPS